MLFVIAIGMTKFEKVREMGHTGYCNMVQANTDVDSFLLGARSLKGFSEDRVVKCMDPNWKGIDDLLK